MLVFSLYSPVSRFSTPEPQDSMCRSVSQLSDDDERMSVGSRGSVRVSIAAQHEQRRLGEPSFHHLPVAFFTLCAVFASLV